MQGTFWILTSTLHAWAAVFPWGWLQQTSRLFWWKPTESWELWNGCCWQHAVALLKSWWWYQSSTGKHSGCIHDLCSLCSLKWLLGGFFQAGLACSLFESTASVKN